jgi:hypothetical protein
MRTDQQPEPAQHVPREAVQQGGQERPVAGQEPRPGLAELPLQDHDLVAQRQDLDDLVPVARLELPVLRELGERSAAIQSGYAALDRSPDTEVLECGLGDLLADACVNISGNAS